MCETSGVVNTVHVQYKLIVLSDTLYCDGDTTCYVLTILVSTIAPPLNSEQILKHVQGVKNWREVGKMLLGYDESKVDTIHREYSSNEDRLRAVVQQWLDGGGLSQPSWRRLVYALDHADNITLADPIRGFAEPPQGESSCS